MKLEIGEKNGSFKDCLQVRVYGWYPKYPKINVLATEL